MAFTQTIKGTSLADSLAGADEGDDFIYGLKGDDELFGFGRHDWLFGGAGRDLLDGGGGNDFLMGGAGADQLFGGKGFDYADYSDSTVGVSLTMVRGTGSGSGGTAEGDVLASIEAIFGSSFDDVLTGGAGSQSFSGMSGNDYLSGGSGADTLDGGDGDDQLFGGDGDDLLQGGAGADSIDGGDGFDMAAYYGAAVEVYLAEQARNAGDAAGDVLIDVEGLYGSAFGDILVGDSGSNQLNGNGGDDILKGRGGDDVLRGGGQNDRLFGGSGNDTFLGGGKLLDGGDADDELNVPISASSLEISGQKMIGGAGADVFHTNADDYAVVRILDFETSVDTLHVHFGGGILPQGEVGDEHFVLGTAALDEDDFFIYDPGTGNLWIDHDGSGDASEKFLFAQLTSLPELSAGDIVI